MSLKLYNQKRTFSKTPEPEGSVEKKSSKKGGKAKSTPQLRFVVQKHHASHLHYDFRLEMEGVLKSWAVPKGPSLDPEVKRLAMMVEDHPVSYINFEGSIPKGNYGAGDVIVWDKGFYHSSETVDPIENEKKLRAGLHKGHINFLLYGEKLKGLFSLVKIKDKNGEGNSWLLVKGKDEYATKDDITLQNQSVNSGKTLPGEEKSASKIPKKATSKVTSPKAGKKKTPDPMPRNIQPMLALLTDTAFDNPKWIYEIKWDGYRAVTEKKGSDIKLYSRNSISFVSRYPSVVKALGSIKKDVVLDGEIIAVDDNGKHSFQALQQYGEKPTPLQYIIFDVLYYDGEDLRNRPLIERKEILREIIPKDHKVLKYGDYIKENGGAFFEEAGKQGLEGIIAKDGESTYHEGRRTESWLKIKHIRTQEATICGFTEPRGSRKKFGALILGIYKDDKLTYIGHTGGGFNESSLKTVYEKLTPLIQDESPFDTKIKVNAPVTWVQPQLVCEIKFTEWTSDGQMRHPIFLGMREDKTAPEIHKEKVKHVVKGSTKNSKKKSVELLPKEEPAEQNFTNLDKVFWPKEKYTKGDVIEYYDKISDIILPYLKDRPESLHRHPNGINKESFYQKDIKIKVPDFVETHKIWSESNEGEINYLLCQNKETLLYLANLGCIEINPWNSRTQALDNPDYMIIDLDPGNNTFDELIKVAKVVHEVLILACEEHYIKTSGKTGLHIVVPLGAQYSYENIRNFSHLLVQMVHKRIPELTSLERSPAKRKDKIYLDYLQNRPGQTIAAPYSLRPWPGATVSTPLRWEEIKKGLDPSKFTIETIFKRLKKYGDLWKPVLESKVDLEKSIKCLEKELGEKITEKRR